MPIFCKKFYTLFLLLIISSIIPLALEYNTNLDVRGWWLFVIVIEFFVYLLYTGIFLFIETIHNNSFRYTIAFSSAISSIILLIGLIGYSVHKDIDWSGINEGNSKLIDWSSINGGGSQLSFWETIATSDYTIPIILVSSLILHLIYTLTQKINK